MDYGSCFFLPYGIKSRTLTGYPGRFDRVISANFFVVSTLIGGSFRPAFLGGSFRPVYVCGRLV